MVMVIGTVGGHGPRIQSPAPFSLIATRIEGPMRILVLAAWPINDLRKISHKFTKLPKRSKNSPKMVL